MALKINDTFSSSFALNQLRTSEKDQLSSLAKIASARRINKAADDAASMAIADALGSQARGLGQAIRNANDTVSLAQVAEGALAESSNIIADIRVKSLQAANASQSAESRKAIQADIDRSLSALNDIAQNTSFNGQKLLSGNFSNKSFQVGASPGETVSLSISSAEAGQLGNSDVGFLSDINVLTEEGAQQAVQIADAALAQINTTRGEIGSVQNQVTSTIANLATTQVNIQAAQSTLADTDFAEETMILTRMNNLQKTGIFAATQAANVNQSSILNILQGE